MSLWLEGVGGAPAGYSLLGLSGKGTTARASKAQYSFSVPEAGIQQQDAGEAHVFRGPKGNPALPPPSPGGCTPCLPILDVRTCHSDLCLRRARQRDLSGRLPPLPSSVVGGCASPPHTALGSAPCRGFTDRRGEAGLAFHHQHLAAASPGPLPSRHSSPRPC